MRVFVTGASGFVGRQAVVALTAAGAEVHGVGRSRPDLPCHWRSADLLSPGQARAAVAAVRPEAVLHLAWCVGHGTFWTDPANMAWREASRELAAAAVEFGVRRFVGVGTCYEYDWPEDGDCREESTPLRRHTPYDTAKSLCRADLAAVFEGADVAFAWARLFFLYGATEDPRRLVGAVARALVRGEAVNCSRGLAVRDYVDVADAGAALSSLALSTARGDFNIGTGVGVSVAALATRLGRLAGRPDLIRLGALPDRADDPPRIVSATERLRRAIGVAPPPVSDQGLLDLLAAWAEREGLSDATVVPP